MNTDIPGDLIVSEEVLADIAGHAALQCYGVVGMAQPAAANGLAKFLPQSPPHTISSPHLGQCFSSQTSN